MSKTLSAPSIATLRKTEVARYYEKMAKRLMPFLLDRPLSIKRGPGSLNENSFVQKKTGSLTLKAIIEKPGGRKTETFTLSKAEELLTLIENGVVELHAWSSTASDLEHPDTIIFDLDPDESVPWAHVHHAALAVREKLLAYNLESFVNTTGGRGLHVRVPIAQIYSWDQIYAFAQDIAEQIARHSPSDYVADEKKSKRHGKIFIDYLLNTRGETTIVPFSLRAKRGGPVALPRSWEDLKKLESSDSCKMLDLINAHAVKNPWADFFKLQQKIDLLAVETVTVPEALISSIPPTAEPRPTMPA